MKFKIKWIVPVLFLIPSAGYPQTNGGGLAGNSTAPVGSTAPGLPATSNSGSSPQGQMGNTGTTTNPNGNPHVPSGQSAQAPGSMNNGINSGTTPQNAPPYRTGNSGNTGAAPSTVQ